MNGGLNKRHDIAGLILAGGRGRRVGGRDKGLLPHIGRPLIEHVIERFLPQVQSLALSANRNPEQYRRYGYPVYRDDDKRFGEYQGPLAGVYTAMIHCDRSWLACAPCDVPHLPHDMVKRLAREAADHTALYAFAERDHYLCCLLSVSLREDLHRFLLSGKRSVKEWYAQIGAIGVEFPDGDDFFNVNDENQLME